MYMIPENFVTTLQAAEMLGRGINQVAKLCQTGRLPGAKKVGNAWIMPRESVLNYRPMAPGVKPGTKRRKYKSAAEKAAILAQDKDSQSQETEKNE
jgi:hypothetical protein